ncbi:MAG: adenylyl-sulfate kinase [Micavibrio sp.]
MRIAFCGKGGSGKTSIASLFIRYLVSKGEEVLAIDGDINQHLSQALGLDTDKIKNLPRLGHGLERLNDYVAGNNPRIDANHVIESTPAGRGSGFIDFNGDDPVSRHFIYRDKNLRFMAVGGHDDHDIGTTCYHKFTGAEGVFLNHLLDTDKEFVIGDMCAGADPFASSGLASRYDAICLVLEPTLKSIGVYEQARQYAGPFGIRLYIIGNKIAAPDDLAFIEEKTGQKCLCHFGDLAIIRGHEKGRDYDIAAIDNAIAESLEEMRKAFHALGPRDWNRYVENGKFFHKRAAEGWANAMYGADLMTQHDPDFDYSAPYTPPQKDAA